MIAALPDNSVLPGSPTRLREEGEGSLAFWGLLGYSLPEKYILKE
jgi:hypothetical protein